MQYEGLYDCVINCVGCMCVMLYGYMVIEKPDIFLLPTSSAQGSSKAYQNV